MIAEKRNLFFSLSDASALGMHVSCMTAANDLSSMPCSLAVMKSHGLQPAVIAHQHTSVSTVTTLQLYCRQDGVPWA